MRLGWFKVEEADDIQKVPASIAGGSDPTTEEVSDQSVKSEDGIQETSMSSRNTSELPPHIIIGMPALSPTMVIKSFHVFKFNKT